MNRVFTASLVLALAAPLVACVERPGGADRGPALYETCAPCHGEDAEGEQDFESPAIAGLPEWYLVSQLDKFQAGVRGDHPDDVNGLRMRGMARTLNHDGDVEAVAEYIASLPSDPGEATLNGSASRGEALYVPCVECHREDASGDPSQNAPPLTALNDWYIVEQLRLFREGIRGTDVEDESGATMRPMTLALANEREMADLAAYIATLRGR